MVVVVVFKGKVGGEGWLQAGQNVRLTLEGCGKWGLLRFVMCK